VDTLGVVFENAFGPEVLVGEVEDQKGKEGKKEAANKSEQFGKGTGNKKDGVEKHQKENNTDPKGLKVAVEGKTEEERKEKGVAREGKA